MYIKKIGHCCLIIKEKNLTILTDPGTYTTGQNEVTGIDVVLITHEHQDHLHIDSVKKIIANNPQVKIITNKSVGALLAKEHIAYDVVADGDSIEIGEIIIEGAGTTHAEIYTTFPRVENTGYFINNTFFYPGDAFFDPKRPIHILALPVAAPWLKISETIEYVLALKPKNTFPVHDGMLNEFGKGFSERALKSLFEPQGITFHNLDAGGEIEL